MSWGRRLTRSERKEQKIENKIRRKKWKKAQKRNKYPVIQKLRKNGRGEINKNEKRWLLLVFGLLLGFVIFSSLGGLLKLLEDRGGIYWLPEWFSIRDGLDWMLPILGTILIIAMGLGFIFNKNEIRNMTDKDPNT